MQDVTNRFTFKLLLSYLVLGALTVLVGYLLYSEFKILTQEKDTQKEEKLIVTGNLVNLVYETDGLSRLALLTLKDEDFYNFKNNIDSLQNVIVNLKTIVHEPSQLSQLDNIHQLLQKKVANTTEFRSLKINNKDTSLDKILTKIRALKTSIGNLTPETAVKNPKKLSKKDAKILKEFLEYTYKTVISKKVPREMIDSMIIQSRNIVLRAKKDNEIAKEILKSKENELIENDLAISKKLREIIAAFDAEIIKYNSQIESTQKDAISKTINVFIYAGIIAISLVLLFSYFVLSDFFKAERFKKSLKQSKLNVENLLKNREQLIQTVSHDVRSPLNTIIGYTELTAQTDLTSQQQNYITQINTSANYVTHLVNDLLDLSKIEAGKLKVEHKPFSLASLIIQTATAVEKNYINKQLLLQINIDQSIKNTLYISDPLRLQQVITNLISNAFKFTEKGKITITINKESIVDNIEILYIAIKDTGIGISENQQQRIFEEFTQVNETTTVHLGYGLGLTISKKITELLGGVLHLESELGAGSTFTLQLPLPISSKVQQQHIKTTYHFPKNITALLLDDDTVMLQLLEELFSSIGITTNTFSSIEALSRQKNILFDIILTDIKMPSVDGFHFIDLLQQGHFDWYTNQPILGMTGSHEHDEAFYISKGFSGLLLKPFTKSKLIKTLSSFFETIQETTTIKEINTTPKLYDLSSIKSFVNDTESIINILQVFAKNTKENIALLQNAISEKEIESLKSIAHKMLSMFRQLQVKKASVILEELENTETENLKEASLLVEELQTEVNKLFKEMKSKGHL